MDNRVWVNSPVSAESSQLSSAVSIQKEYWGKKSLHKESKPGSQRIEVILPSPPLQYFTQSKRVHHSTRGSRVIPQRSTNLAQLCLTSEIGRDRVFSEWFDRGM